eukprot:Clim_evm65s218 gene=Clim_evmTU65s218
MMLAETRAIPCHRLPAKTGAMSDPEVTRTFWTGQIDSRLRLWEKDGTLKQSKEDVILVTANYATQTLCSESTVKALDRLSTGACALVRRDGHRTFQLKLLNDGMFQVARVSDDADIMGNGSKLLADVSKHVGDAMVAKNMIRSGLEDAAFVMQYGAARLSVAIFPGSATKENLYLEDKNGQYGSHKFASVLGQESLPWRTPVPPHMAAQSDSVIFKVHQNSVCSLLSSHGTSSPMKTKTLLDSWDGMEITCIACFGTDRLEASGNPGRVTHHDRIEYLVVGLGAKPVVSLKEDDSIRPVATSVRAHLFDIRGTDTSTKEIATPGALHFFRYAVRHDTATGEVDVHGGTDLGRIELEYRPERIGTVPMNLSEAQKAGQNFMAGRFDDVGPPQLRLCVAFAGSQEEKIREYRVKPLESLGPSPICEITQRHIVQGHFRHILDLTCAGDTLGAVILRDTRTTNKKDPCDEADEDSEARIAHAVQHAVQQAFPSSKPTLHDVDAVLIKRSMAPALPNRDTDRAPDTTKDAANRPAPPSPGTTFASASETTKLRDTVERLSEENRALRERIAHLEGKVDLVLELLKTKM